MAIYLAPVNPETDYPRIAELMNAASRSCVMVERLREEDENARPGRMHLRIAAVDAGGRILGYGDVGRDADLPAGRFWFDIVVDGAAQRRGVGSMLYDDIVQFAREQGATSLEIAIRENASAGLRFAARRGFTVERHISAETVVKDDGVHATGYNKEAALEQPGFYTFVSELM